MDYEAGYPQALVITPLETEPVRGIFVDCNTDGDQPRLALRIVGREVFPPTTSFGVDLAYAIDGGVPVTTMWLPVPGESQEGFQRLYPSKETGTAIIDALLGGVWLIEVTVGNLEYSFETHGFSQVASPLIESCQSPSTPASTPTPRPTITPTATPKSTSTPESNQWTSTGNWYQDALFESTLNVVLQSQGLEGQTKVATLDANPTGWGSDLSFSLGCVTGLGVAYLSPYSYTVPPSVDTYVVGMWDGKAGSWVQEDLGWYTSPTLVDDGSAIYVVNRTQLRQIIGILETANENQNSDLVLSIGMFDSTNEDGLELWGEFDPTGLRDALQYLPCL